MKRKAILFTHILFWNFNSLSLKYLTHSGAWHFGFSAHNHLFLKFFQFYLKIFLECIFLFHPQLHHFGQNSLFLALSLLTSHSDFSLKTLKFCPRCCQNLLENTSGRPSGKILTWAQLLNFSLQYFLWKILLRSLN